MKHPNILFNDDGRISKLVLYSRQTINEISIDAITYLNIPIEFTVTALQSC